MNGLSLGQSWLKVVPASQKEENCFSRTARVLTVHRVVPSVGVVVQAQGLVSSRLHSPSTECAMAYIHVREMHSSRSEAGGRSSSVTMYC